MYLNVFDIFNISRDNCGGSNSNLEHLRAAG